MKIRTFCRFHHKKIKKKQPSLIEVDPHSNTISIENAKLSYSDYTIEITKNKYKFDLIYNESSQEEINNDFVKLIMRDVFLNSNFNYYSI